MSELLRKWWKLIATATLFVILVFAIRGYIEREKQLAEMNAKIAASEELNKKLQENNQQLQGIIEQVRADANRRLLAIQKQREAVKTPEQAIKVVQQSTPLADAKLQTLPDAPSVLSQADAKKLADFALEMQQMRVELEAVKLENQNSKQLLANKDEQIKILTKERDEAIKTVKGGSFWRRTAKAGKFVLAGIGIGLTLGKL